MQEDQFRISASGIGAFLSNQCERAFLRSSSLTIGRGGEEISAWQRAVLDKGVQWEEEIISDLEQGGCLRRVDAREGQGALVAVMDELRRGEGDAAFPHGIFIHGFEYNAEASRLVVPQNVRIGRCKPDFLRLKLGPGNVVEVMIIDAKHSPVMKASHVVQVAFYALTFPIVVGARLSALGGVWRPERPLTPNSFESFELAGASRMLETWLREDLPWIVGKGVEGASWTFIASCKTCTYMQDCREETLQRNLFGRIPNLTRKQVAVIRGATQMEQPRIQDIEDLAQPWPFELSRLLRVSNDDNDEEGGVSPILEAAKRPVNSPWIPLSVNTPLLGPDQAVHYICLSLLTDPEGSLISWAASGGGQGLDSVSLGLYLGAQIRSMVRDARRFQLIVWGVSEARSLIQLIVKNACQDGPNSQVWMELTCLVRTLDALPLEAPQAPMRAGAADALPSPIVVSLESVARDWYAMTCPGFVTLGEALRALLQEEDAVGDLAARFGEMAMEDGTPFELEEIFALPAEGPQRMDALRARTLAVQRLLREFLRRGARDGLLVGHAPVVHPVAPLRRPIIARLLFLKEYAAYFEMNKLLFNRCRSEGPEIALKVPEGADLAWQREGKAWCKEFEVTSGSQHLEFDADGLFTWILRDAARASCVFQDSKFYDKLPWHLYLDEDDEDEQGVAFANLVKLVRVDNDSLNPIVQVCIRNVPYAFEEEECDQFVLQPRFVDLCLSKVAPRLKEIGDLDRANCLSDLLSDCVSFGRVVPQPRGYVIPPREVMRVGPFIMSDSQKRCLEHVLQRRVTVLWGPPGSGKTRTLSIILAKLARHLKTVGGAGGSPLILVTALTNAALDQLFSYVQEIVNLMGIQDEVCVKRITSKNKRTDESLLIEGKATIQVGTVWSLVNPNFKPGTQVHAIFVDEGSQFLPADLAMIATPLIDGGRLVVAGDFLQLAPVLKFNVDDLPSLAEGEFNPSASLMESLLRTDENRLIDPMVDFNFEGAQNLVSLLDNFRMTPALCACTNSRYPGLSFVHKTPFELSWQDDMDSPFNQHISRAVTGSGRVSVIMRPSAAAQIASHEVELAFEAGLVKRLLRSVLDHFRLRAGDGGGELRPPKHVFIVTPHRAQRAIILQAVEEFNTLEENDGGGADPLHWRVQVDTVEKMQGREADVVIACYGFLNPTLVESELDFVFHPNRINVALSRGRALVILLASSAVERPSLAVLASPKMMRGVQFLRGFIEGSEIFQMHVEREGGHLVERW